MPQLSGWVDRIEAARGLDPAVRTLSAVAAKALPGQGVRDLLHGVWLGHPLHPLLTDVPLGAWLSAAALDLLPGTERASSALVGLGVATAAPTALAGLADWSALNRPEQRTGVVHAFANAVALALYGGSYAARSKGRHGLGKRLALAGLGAVGFGGLLGGHLSYRRAAGVNHTADVKDTMPSGWTVIATLDELPDGTLTVRQLGRVPVLLYRRGRALDALVDRCSHLSGPLHEGELREVWGETCVVCPWHGSTFRLRDGSVVHGPATAPQPRLRTRVTGEQVEVELVS
jgi:nitrite reductase/ring-hydroxylating ferredoxin subunit